MVENSFNDSYLISIKNITGQEVILKEISANNQNIQEQISVSTLSDGIYFVSVESKNNRVIKKVIIQH